MLRGTVFVLLNPYVFLSRGESSGQVLHILEVFYIRQAGDAVWEPLAAAMEVLRPLRHGPERYNGLTLAFVPSLSSDVVRGLLQFSLRARLSWRLCCRSSTRYRIATHCRSCR
jgi:hypothetical protein